MRKERKREGEGEREGREKGEGGRKRREGKRGKVVSIRGPDPTTGARLEFRGWTDLLPAGYPTHEVR